MLNRVPKIGWIAIGLAYLIGFVFVVGWSSAQPPHHAKIYQSTQTPKEKSYQDISAEIIAYYTKVLACFTGILAIATIGLGTGTYFQVKLARQEFLSTHRPKIRIKHVWLMNAFWYDVPVNVRVVCVNVGTTDAQLVDYGVDFLIIRRGRSLPPDHQFAFRRVISTVLKAGISGPFPDLDYILTEADEIDVRNNAADFYCVGYLHYMDSAGRIRTTAFCRRLVLEGQRSGHFVKVEHPDYEYED